MPNWLCASEMHVLWAVCCCAVLQSTEREKKAEEKEEEEVGKAQETKGEKEEAPAYGDADHTSPQPS